MKITLYVCSAGLSRESEAIQALLDFVGLGYEVIHDSNRVIQHYKGNINPTAGVFVLCNNETVNGFWALTKWIQDKGLVRI